MDFSLSHLIWSTILVTVASHLGANYLKDHTPRGYGFWFLLISFALGIIFL